jgi:4-diphosphocytidyl-2-C-methyl-D-erythritol kinase
MLLREVVTKSSTPSELSIFAPAKINLILRILDRRSDGYHNLWSLMHTVALEDELHIRLCPDQGEIRLRCDVADLKVDHTNLVHRAATAVLARAQRSIGLDIYLRKRIPMGAGLGGGSSDAAATIVGLNRLLQLDWSASQMADVGEALGSDVPFFFYAPAAMVSGRGEVVVPTKIEGIRWTVLVNPGFGVETKWAYQELASTRREPVRSLTSLQHDIAHQTDVSWSQLSQAVENDFESPVFAAHGALREIKQGLRQQGADIALLSGSGATVFGLFAEEARAQQAERYFSSEKRFSVFMVPTCIGPLTVG